ncbi:IS701 family transposase [Ktedonobacter sp. SOSP1-85]|uniref:IS701 family transposase n=1 Tax=Ktedonobacter sp. SOSP1-85 TaxID=2778367 RepID=UPI0019151562|nr:IS701 family transposase [Ktedonobacter sp. SOSP1-85]
MGSWLQSLLHLHQRLSPRFARPEVHLHALLYLQAVLSDIPRKNGWHIAEHARQARPYGMQRLLSQAVWNEDGVRDDLRALVCQTLLLHPLTQTGIPLFPVLVIDESGFPKRGHHSAGVAPQYCGRTGRVENCQVGVFLSYVTARGHALIDRELYLPEEWCADLLRRRAAHIPDQVPFATKPELAKRMVQRAQAAGLSICWVVADTVYGHSPDLRLFLEEQGYAYAMAVPSIEVMCVQTPTGCLLSDVASIAKQALRARDWLRLSASQGTKGERLFDWACLPIVQAGTPDGRHWLVFRRCLDNPNEVAYFLVWALSNTSLPTMVQAIGCRWHIEEDLQACKALGLDQYEVRSYLGWYRHITLVILAYAFLVNICLKQLAPPGSQEEPPPSLPLLPLTPSEVHHLLARLFFPAPTSAPLISAWSLFRRTHQYWAGYYHRRRRQKARSA